MESSVESKTKEATPRATPTRPLLTPEDEEVDEILQRCSPCTTHSSDSSSGDESPKSPKLVVKKRRKWRRASSEKSPKSLAKKWAQIPEASPPAAKRLRHPISSPPNSSPASPPMTNLERLIRTHPIWFLPKLNREEANLLLHGKEEGAFLVRQSSQSDTMALSVRLSDESCGGEEEDLVVPHVEHYLLQQESCETGSTKMRLESSQHSFDNVLSLVYHYSSIKEELPTLLSLPQTLREADSRQTLSSLALLGKDFWRYPMSFGGQCGSRQPSLSPQPSPRPRRYSLQRADLHGPQTDLHPARKLSVPVKTTLEETLFGLQEVSDLLQASLREIEQTSAKGGAPVFDMRAHAMQAPKHIEDTFVKGTPAFDASERASDFGQPAFDTCERASEFGTPAFDLNERASEFGTPAFDLHERAHDFGAPAAEDRLKSPPLPPQRSPSVRARRRSDTEAVVAREERRSARHSVCKMVVTKIPLTKFPATASRPLYSQSSKKQTLDPGDLLLMDQPIFELHNKLSEEMFGDKEDSDYSSSTTQHWYRYYRSSIADKMSDYEDIWDSLKKDNRSITPAESEIQFKAYLANKLQDSLPSSQTSSSGTSSTLFSTTSSNCTTTGSTGSSDMSMTDSSLSDRLKSKPDDKCSLGDSSCNSDDLEPIYADPLDALEKATDTRIYHCPEFGQVEEVLYEEAKQPQQIQLEQPIKVTLVKAASLEQLDRVEKAGFSLENVRKLSSGVDQRRKKSNRGEGGSGQDGQKRMSGLSHLGKRNENRLSAVLGKYMRPPVNTTSQKQGWQVDSSSWEFLGQDQPENEADVSSSDTSTDLPSSSAVPASKVGVQEKSPEPDSGLEQSRTLDSVKTEDLTKDSLSRDSVYESEYVDREEVASNCQTSTKQLQCSRRRIQEYVRETLATDEMSFFGQVTRAFVKCTKDSITIGKHNPDQRNVLTNVRQFITGIKNYLVRSGEKDLLQIVDQERAKLRPDEFMNVDTLLEEVLHTLILSPLMPSLEPLMQQCFCSGHLGESMAFMKATFALMDSGVPQLTQKTLEMCLECFQHLHEAISPLDKLAHLLTAIRILINNTGVPQIDSETLCIALAKLMCNLNETTNLSEWIQADLELVWTLLPPTVLKSANGETTFYLTLLSSALNLILQHHKQNKPDETCANTTASLNSQDSSNSSVMLAKSTIHLKVYFPTLDNGDGGSIEVKTVPLRCESTTSAEVCRVLAHMAKINSPHDFALFSITNGQETRLSDGTKPRQVKEDAKRDGTRCAFAYRRTEVQIAWPTHLGDLDDVQE